MKKSIVFIYVMVFCVSLLQYSAIRANGDAELPEWIVGDKWKYETTEPNTTADVTIEVIDITSINVNGTNYNVYVVNQTSKISMPGINVTEKTVFYTLRSDLTVVKTETNHTGPMGVLAIVVTTYDPPKKNYDFPLVVGETWTSECTKSIYQETVGYTNSTETINFKVVGKESIKVKAGKFECYKIEIDEGSGTTAYTWYSPEAKNMVKTTGGLPLELTSSPYGSKENGPDSSSIPYALIFIPIIIVILIVVIVVWKKFKGRK